MTASGQTARPTLLLLHGWGMNHAVWRDLLPRLQGEWRCLAPDLPGHGLRAGEPFPALDALADEMLSRLPPGGGTVLGWSLGGLVALRMAERDPGRVRRLLLVASSPRFVQAPDWPHALAPEVLQAFADGFVQDPLATLRRFLALQTRGARLDRTQFHALRDAVLALPPSEEALAAGLALLRDTDLRPVVQRLQRPPAWLLGGEDRIVPAAVARDLMRLRPDLDLEVWTRCAHLPFIEEADGFVDWLRQRMTPAEPMPA